MQVEYHIIIVHLIVKDIFEKKNELFLKKKKSKNFSNYLFNKFFTFLVFKTNIIKLNISIINKF